MKVRVETAFVPSLPVVPGSQEVRLGEEFHELSVLELEILSFLQADSDRNRRGLMLDRDKMSTKAPSRTQQPYIVRLDPCTRSREEFTQRKLLQVQGFLGRSGELPAVGEDCAHEHVVNSAHVVHALMSIFPSGDSLAEFIQTLLPHVLLASRSNREAEIRTPEGE